MRSAALQLVVLVPLAWVIGGVYPRLSAGAPPRPTLPSPTLTRGLFRVGVVDLGRVLREWSEYRMAGLESSRLQEKAPEWKRLSLMQERIQHLRKKIGRERDPRLKDRFESEKKRLLSALATEFSDMKNRLRLEQERRIQVLRDRIYEVIARLADAEKLSIVVEKQWVYFPRAPVDVTDRVIQRLNSAVARRSATP